MATCNVSMTIETGGTAVSGAVVLGQHKPRQSNPGQTVIPSRNWMNTTTDANGLATLTFERGTRGRIVCEQAGLDVEFDVPQAATYNIAKEDL